MKLIWDIYNFCVILFFISFIFVRFICGLIVIIFKLVEFGLVIFNLLDCIN